MASRRFDFDEELFDVGQDDLTEAEDKPDDVGLSENDGHEGGQRGGFVELLELKVVGEQEEESGADVRVVEELKEVVQRKQADREAAQDVDEGSILIVLEFFGVEVIEEQINDQVDQRGHDDVAESEIL